MTPKNYIDWLKAAIDFIGGVPSENQWRQITDKLSEVETKRPRKKQELVPTDEEIRILAFLNEKTGQSLQSKDCNIKFIRGRLTDGATEQEMRQVIVIQCREWLTDTKMRSYLTPATLFNETKYEKYRAKIGQDLRLVK